MKIKVLSCIGSILSTLALLVPPALTAAEPVLMDQGTKWTASDRKDFYSRDQGSRIMPLRWISALKQPNGQPFMAESLPIKPVSPQDYLLDLPLPAEAKNRKLA